MARRTQKSDSTEVQRLRKSLAREKAKRLSLERSLAEAREQTAATSDILNLVRRSTSDLQPVFDAIARHALALCGGMHANVFGFDGKLMHFIASENAFTEQVDLMRASFPRRPDVLTAGGRAILAKAVVRIEDALEDPEYDRRVAIAGGLRRVLAVPMMGENAALGAIAVAWPDAGPIPRVQEELLQTFAAHAVIAIENARLFNETKEALEHQKASADILRVISGSPTDLAPVMAAVAESAARLCDATDAHIWQREGDEMQLVASYGERIVRRPRLHIGRESVVGRAAADCRLVHVEDLAPVWQSEFPDSKVMAEGGYRSVLAVPLVREGFSIGAILIRRREVRPFSQKQLALLQTFADQAVIAIENVRLFNETKEALERQTATAEILNVIARSPADVQPVLDAVAENAARLCGATDALILTVEEGMLRRRAHVGPIVSASASRPLTPGTPSGRAILERRTIHIEDILAEIERGDYPEARELQRNTGFRTILSVPLMRDDAMLGVIGIRRLEVQPFSEKQIALVQTFADQAVIAIENVRLFNELQSKNAALTDALNQQTATAEILRSMSSSLTDVQPVFDTIVKSGLRLLDGYSATLTLLKADVLELAAFTSTGDEGDSSITHLFPVALHTMAPAAECVASRRPVVVEDIEQAAGVSEGFRETIRARGWRSALFVPMIRNDVVLGILSVTRRAAGPFAPGETALLETFADQAVIAIENVRLFNETKEALERQTATSEILKVIASSPSEVQPVFDSIVRSAIRLLNGVSGGVCISDGVQAEMVAAALAEGEDRTLRFRSDYPAALDYKAPAVQAIRENRVINVPEIAKGDYAQAVLQRARDHYRSAVAIPMHRGDKAIGSISVTRREPGLFPAHHVELLQTFADQAVIAIENVRLFNETKEALERQTATAEILKVISSSPASVQPVFDAILEQALRLCQASFGYAYTSDGNAFDLTAQRGLEGETLQAVTAAYSQTRIAAPSTALGRVRSTRRPVHIADAREEEAYKSKDPRRVATVEKAGARTMLAVPLLKNDAVIGAVIIYRREVRLFDAKQIALLQTFADQAVIAIENVRLFNETKEALERQTATADILKVIGSSPTDTQPVFEAIVEAGLKLFPGATVGVTRPNGDLVEMVAIAHQNQAVAETTRRRFPIPLTRDYLHSTAILDGTLVDVPDAELAQDGPFAPGVRNFLASGNRAMTVMPMMREEKAIGAISVTRAWPGPLSDKQIALLRIFADQAVIAIENVRLFNETKEALERQTATAEILKVISSSPTDVQPVFEAIVESAIRLLQGATAHVTRLEAGRLHLVAYSRTDAAGAAALKQLYPLAVAGTAVAEVLGRQSPLIVADAETDPRVSDEVRAATRARRVRSFILVPLVSKGISVGTLVVNRRQAGNFSAHQIELLRTFADQAVIAIENVRLFRELESRTEALSRSVQQLTALGEVGHAISSTLDLDTVLKTIVARAVQLTGLDFGTIYEFDEAGEQFELRAWQNMPQKLVDLYRSMPIRLGEGIVGRAAVTGEPVQVPDIQDSGYQTRYRDILLREGYRAVLAVPLLREGRIIGAITVSRSKPGAFPAEVVDLLKTFATQSALAIQNARLFREIAEKSRQLEEASQHKSQFLASMSHELRTPLNAILGFNEMLLGEVYGPLSEDMQPPLAQMQTSGKHLLRLINNVLDLAKIEAGRMELALSDYSVHDTVESVRATLRPLAEAKGLDFVVELPPELPLARGDPGRITQCLMNLAGNSLKFTKAGKVEIRVDHKDELLVYRVADTGIGIPADKIESLFTEFKQTDATIASEYGGTGLGLSISKKFIEMHGGRIWAESEPGQGSTFIFEIPLRAGEEGTA